MNASRSNPDLNYRNSAPNRQRRLAWLPAGSSRYAPTGDTLAEQVDAMRVVVTSDTHLPRFGRELPKALVTGLETADLIVHCGDLTQNFVLEMLREYAPTIAVAGNNDGPELHSRLPTMRTIEIERTRFGLTHGHLGKGRTTPDRAFRLFADDQAAVDAICFGHSHIPLVEKRGSVWLLNPGSATDKRRLPYFSYLIIEVNGHTIDPELVKFESRT